MPGLVILQLMLCKCEHQLRKSVFNRRYILELMFAISEPQKSVLTGEMNEQVMFLITCSFIPPVRPTSHYITNVSHYISNVMRCRRKTLKKHAQ